MRTGMFAGLSSDVAMPHEGRRMRADEIMGTNASEVESRSFKERAAELSLVLFQESDERDRRLLVLRRTFGLDHHEIASLLGEAVHEIRADLERLEFRIRELAESGAPTAEPPVGLS